jgi:hypothetical protein
MAPTILWGGKTMLSKVRLARPAVRRCLAAACLLSVSSVSSTADISTPRPGVVSLAGTIVKGDAEKLRTVIGAQRFGLGSIVLDSPGGEVDEAIRMADLVRPLFVAVTVAPGRFCASACFFVWLAGSPRYGQSQELAQRLAKKQSPLLGGIVGLHRPFRGNIDSVANDQHQLMRRIQGYFEQQLLSRRLIDLMMSRPSNDVYWLTSGDFEELGEYPPQVEELLINKCGYVRVTSRSASQDLDADRMVRSLDCTNKLLSDARAKALSNIRN